MPCKKKSRNIVSLPTTGKEKEPNIIVKSGYDCLGEDINSKSGTPVNSLSTHSSDLEGFLDLGIKISGLSSGSSLSWSEEYELEIGKRVQFELEKLDRIFQQSESDPYPYDKEEITEWKHFFPNLYLLGPNTPTNSAENSEVDTSSDDDIYTESLIEQTFKKHMLFPRNRSSAFIKNRPEFSIQNGVNSKTRNFNSLPRKPRSLEIDQYLKISSIKSPDTRKRKSHTHSLLNKQSSRELSDGVSPDYTSLPFITATPLKTQYRKPFERNKPTKTLILPPIENTFRSISATPRQASSKSLYASLNYERHLSRKDSQAKLTRDLMKLFDHIPISNR